jgi:hypothetical protein
VPGVAGQERNRGQFAVVIEIGWNGRSRDVVDTGTSRDDSQRGQAVLAANTAWHSERPTLTAPDLVRQAVV